MPRPAYSARTIDRPESILNAALAIFSEKGFDGARTRDIAARADVTLGLVQYHYGSKEKLWKEAVERAFGDLEGRIADLVSDPSEDSAVDVRERLRRLLLAHVSFVAEQPDFIRIMHDEGKRRGPRMRWLVDSYVKPFHERITPLIVQAQEQGVLPSGIAPTHFIYVMIGAVGMFFHQAEECKRVSGIDPADPAAIDAHTRALEAMFLGTAGMEIE